MKTLIFTSFRIVGVVVSIGLILGFVWSMGNFPLSFLAPPLFLLLLAILPKEKIYKYYVISIIGSLLSFIFAHASIIGLRIKKPQLERPFKIRLNIKIKQREIPVSAILALLALSAIWIIIVVTQPYSRYVGFAWMAIGLIFYYLFCYRKR